MRFNYSNHLTSILLVGCGDLGSRHLQALAKLHKNSEIHIVEPNKKAQVIAKKRLKEVDRHMNHIFFWHSDIEEVKVISDLVIIATTSTGRADLLLRLLDLGHSKFLVEKLVCQSVKEYKKILRKIENKNAKAWIDLPRRYFPAYMKLKNLLQKDDDIFINIIAGNEGLGANTIHWYDLFSWYKEDMNIKLNGDLILKKTFPNKRGKNLKEFAGTITGNSSNSILNLTYFQNKNMSRVIEIVSEKIHLIIDETNEKVIPIRGVPKITFKYEHASNLTTKIVEDILKDSCHLPSLSYSFNAHSEIFRILNQHLRKYESFKNELCPIT